MSFSDETPQMRLDRFRQIFDDLVPEAKCELFDYGHKIRCGAADRWDNIQEVKITVSMADEVQARHLAQVLKNKLATGGSTAG